MHMTRNLQIIILITIVAGLGVLPAIPFAAAEVEVIDMNEIIEGEYGGSIEIPYLSDLYIARKGRRAQKANKTPIKRD